MSLNDNIADFATSSGNGDGTYTVTRRAAGTTTNGRYTPGASSTFTITAVVVPLGSAGLDVVPEGYRVEDLLTVLTDVELRPSATGPDTLVVNGEAYAVYSVNSFEIDGETHWEAKIARQVVP